MKNYACITVIVVLSALIFSTSISASGKDKTRHLTYDKIETNLLAGLESDNFGLSVSSAYMLGEIKSEKAILPLTRMLREAEDERARIVAAISLIKIGSERSTYVVKQGIQFNGSAKVRKMCDHLYHAHLRGDLENTRTYENNMLARLFIEK
jgi:hypothetical protein